MKELAKPTVGDSDLGQWLNRMRDNVGERTPRAGDGIEIDYYPDHFRIKSTAKGGEGGSGKVEQFRVESIHRDHIKCKQATWNTATLAFDVTGSLVRVAKPEGLRVYLWDNVGQGLIIGTGGYHYEYVAGGTQEASLNPYTSRRATLMDASDYDAVQVDATEEIWPAYIAGRSIICAAKLSSGTVINVTEAGTSYNVAWVDLNADGRSWQQQLRKLRVCVEGQTGPRFILIRASDTFQES